MEIKYTYICSLDGEEFETEEECLEYERNIAGCEGIAFFDVNRELVKVEDAVATYEQAYYIYILNKELADRYFAWLFSHYGYDFVNDSKEGHTYMYNTRTCEYEDLGETINNLIGVENDILDQVKKVKEREIENGNNE